MSSDWYHLEGFIKLHRGQSLALASLIKIDGTSYRQVGARLLVNQLGDYSGSLSGGCLEQGVAKVAEKVLVDGRTRLEKINTEPHFGCPGVLTILIEKVDPYGLLDEISQKLLAREPFTVTTTRKGSSLIASDGFCEEVTPRPRLIVIGWTSDQEPLFKIAQTLNWECSRICNDQRVIRDTPISAGESIRICAPDDLQATFVPDSATAVLVMSHHMVTDLAYLKAAAHAGYSYLGLLGSKRRREKLLNELGELGMLENTEWLDSFHAPVGLDIGADHPTTIALSILAEIQAVFAGAKGGFYLKNLVGFIKFHLYENRDHYSCCWCCFTLWKPEAAFRN